MAAELKTTASAVPARRREEGGDVGATDAYQKIKFKTFELTLEYMEINGGTASSLTRGALQDEIARALSVALVGQGVALNSTERSRLIQEVQNEIVGLGPLEPLLADATINDIIVNGPHQVYVERAGKLERVQVRFRDDQHLINIIQRIVSPIGRRVDESTPYVDARLKDGSRVNVIIPPVALDGPMVSIRKFRKNPIKAQEMVRTGTLSPEMLEYLQDAVHSRLNVLISGGTGAGKTTMLNACSTFIGSRERIVTIEDAAELRLQQDHVVRLETRPSTADGVREVSARDLMRNALRMRPDRIILGEVRGPEVVDMLQAMSTGHDGSMATLHANNTRDALNRVEMLLNFGGFSGDVRTIRRYIVSSINVIVQVTRLSTGERKITSIAELTGLEGEYYTFNELFSFEENPPMSGLGHFRVLSRHSHFKHRLAGAGRRIESDMRRRRTV